MDEAVAVIDRIRRGCSLSAADGIPWDADDDHGVAHLRVPPHSIEAEQSVLGGLLIDNRARAGVEEVLSAADFYRHEHQVVFAGIFDVMNAGSQADVITVYERLKSTGQHDQVGGLSYLQDLANSVPSAANVRKYADIVRERSILRRLIAASDSIATSAFNPQGRPLEKILVEAEEHVALLLRDQNRKLPGTRVPLLGLDALRQASESITWLCKHVLPAESIGMLFGGSGTFKSFIALDCALHVAHGLPWMGRRTTKGPVLYIAAEGGAGLWARIDAWHRARKLRWQDAQLFVVPAAIDLTSDAWRVVDAAQAVGVSPLLVVVDTLSQTYAGEENSANEMAAYLRELALRFRSLWQCTVLLIHHTGHQATERPRGSSAIRANLDFMLGVFRDEKEMLATVSCNKQKDGELFEDSTFSMRVIELGTDADGDRVTSLVARHLSSAEEIGDAMQAEAKAGRVGKNQLLLNLVQNGMRLTDLRKVFGDECGLDDADSRRRVFNRAKTWAIDKGFIEVAQGIVITLKSGT